MERLVLINGVVSIVPLRSSLFDKRCLPHFVRALRVICLLPMMVYLFDNLSSLRCTVGKKLPAELLLAILLILVIFLLLFLDVCLRKSKGLGVRFCSHILHPVVGTHVHIIARGIPLRWYLGLFDGAEIDRVLLAVDSVQWLRRIVIITYWMCLFPPRISRRPSYGRHLARWWYPLTLSMCGWWADLVGKSYLVKWLQSDTGSAHNCRFQRCVVRIWFR